ncbi:MAG: hypothetical protein DWQ37_12950 [Planctomycetota bacterium]|nr:MAG: hypothetical protein DWQ37_12950 [Planctomycetota bacterium]
MVLSLAMLAATLRAGVIQERDELYAAYAAKLDTLAETYERDGDMEAAETLRGWLPERRADQLTLFVVPSALADADSDDKPAAWQERWQQLRNQQAEALVALAQQAVDERPSLAYQLVVEAVRENPEHQLARRALGYVQYRDLWLTPFEIRQLKAGRTWHERFGWLPRAHVERYEQGQRFALGRWMSADEEAELRGDLRRGWSVETEHYKITTNHSLEEGVALARRLETLYDLWQQVFITYLMSETELKRQLSGRARPRIARQHEVVYYRTRDEYNAALRSAQPQIDITLGIYFDQTRSAYFFAGEEQAPGTLYHEATHQLFGETRRTAPRVARDDNFWIVEGIACYMESLAEHDGYYTLGGANAGRVPAARHRLLVDESYVPLSELVGFGMEDLQHDQRIAMLYSQSAGLADFLMHADDGRYRDALAGYLAAIYGGRASEGTLAELTGKEYEALDCAYRQYMEAGE